jgi:hypothetical protein
VFFRGEVYFVFLAGYDNFSGVDDRNLAFPCYETVEPVDIFLEMISPPVSIFSDKNLSRKMVPGIVSQKLVKGRS